MKNYRQLLRKAIAPAALRETTEATVASFTISTAPVFGMPLSGVFEPLSEVLS